VRGCPYPQAENRPWYRPGRHARLKTIDIKRRRRHRDGGRRPGPLRARPGA
jgi:hypothetical protein